MARTLSGRARLAGVMGWPVSHSLSPRLHGYWLARHGIDGAYVPLAVRPGDCADALRMLPKLGFSGCNLTVPHKETALGVIDRLSDRARRIGAVNTVVVAEDGDLFGDNTDAFGFEENLRHGVPGWSAASGPAVVLGAGGASRAVCAALMDGGAPEVRLVNRTGSRAEALAAELGARLRAVAWEDAGDVLADAALLVNTTILGMEGQPTLALSLDRLPDSAVVTDIVYAPLRTPLLTRAAARGLRTVDGLGMLLHQARPGFKAWFGTAPAVDDDLRDFVLQSES